MLISQTAPGQELNVYAGSQGGENFTIPMLEAAMIAEEVEEIIEEEIIEEEIIEEEIMEEEVMMLPSTAGQAGWFAILGTMLLLLAGVAHVVRSRS